MATNLATIRAMPNDQHRTPTDSDLKSGDAFSAPSLSVPSESAASGHPDPGLDVERFAASIHRYPEVQMRAAIVAERLQGSSPKELSRFIEVLYEHRTAHPYFHELWSAFCRLLDRGHLDNSLVERTRQLLQDQGLSHLGEMLVQESWKEHAQMRPIVPGGRKLTLGERKSLARKNDRRLLERLAQDPDPRVVRIVLANSRTVERDVVRIAASHRAMPVVLSEIAMSPRWNNKLTVIRALLFNPATPTESKMRLLPHLRRQDLAELADAADQDLAAIIRSLGLTKK